MRTQILASMALVSVLMAQPAPTTQTDDGGWDAPRLKQSLVDIGYEPKDLSDTKWEVKLTKGGFNVPIGAELSGSGKYIWLTATLGEKPSDEKAGRLLQRNFKIQPTQFFVTEKGQLRVALACENRAMTNAVIRKALDKISDDVAATADDWGK